MSGEADNPAGATDAAGGTGEKTHTVLIIEDTVELAEILQATLERLNLDVFHEAHGNKAVDRYFEVQPDVVLLDIALPDITGWKVLDTIREERRGGKPLKIIVITAYGDPANRLMGKLQDVEGYLIKPFKPDDVEAEVRRVLRLPKA